MEAYVSPIASASLIFGIILIAVLPPVGLGLIVFAFFSQRSYRGRVRSVRDHQVAKAREKIQRDKLAAGRYFAS